MKFKIALAQTRACRDIGENLREAEKMMREAAKSGAKIIVFPEVFLSSFSACAPAGDRLSAAVEIESEPVKRMRSLAAGNSLWTVFGMYEPASGGKNYNTTLIIDDAGGIAGVYRKTHMYDAFSYKESNYILPGEKLFEPVCAPFARLGLMVCYEVRFPEVARYEALRGAEVILMPTAWFDGKGKKEQLEILTRCRALENTVYVAMCDVSGGGRCAGSMIAGPMGDVIARAGDEPGIVTAEIDTEKIPEAREILPALYNRRGELYEK